MTKVRVRLPNIHAWLTADRTMKALLGVQVVLAALSVGLHAIAAIRTPEHRLTEISCAVAWFCVVIWALGTWHWSEMYFQMREECERLARGLGGTFTSG